MTWEDTIVFVNRIRGGYLWASVPAKVFATPQTALQARRDNTKTHDYQCQITVE